MAGLVAASAWRACPDLGRSANLRTLLPQIASFGLGLDPLSLLTKLILFLYFSIKRNLHLRLDEKSIVLCSLKSLIGIE